MAPHKINLLPLFLILMCIFVIIVINHNRHKEEKLAPEFDPNCEPITLLISVEGSEAPPLRLERYVCHEGDE